MIRKALFGAVVCAFTLATPATAATMLTWDFGRASGTVNVASVAATTGAVTLTATALRFTALPDMLTSLTQTIVAGQIQQTVPGIGINGGGSDPQLDTNTPTAREAILLTATESFSLTGFRLSYIDNDDTLQIYGVGSDGTLAPLGFGGTIITGLAGAATHVNTSANSTTVVLALLDPTARFRQYLFTSRVGGDQLYLGARGQGYRIDSISGTVPEPASWAMLITGFGIVGVAARRRRGLIA